MDIDKIESLLDRPPFKHKLLSIDTDSIDLDGFITQDDFRRASSVFKVVLFNSANDAIVRAEESFEKSLTEKDRATKVLTKLYLSGLMNGIIDYVGAVIKAIEEYESNE